MDKGMNTEEHLVIINTELSTPIRIIDEHTKEEVICTLVHKGEKEIVLAFLAPLNVSVIKDVLYKESKNAIS